MKKHALLFLTTLFFLSCATFKPQYKTEAVLNQFPNNKEIEHTFYLIGDAGNSDLGETSSALKAFQRELGNADENSTAVFLGDNIYPCLLYTSDAADD